MALLHVDGFDHYEAGTDTEALLKGYRTATAGATTATGRDGVGSALNLNNVSVFLEYAPGTSDELTVGFACYLVAKPTVYGQVVTFTNPTFQAFCLSFEMNTSAQIVAKRFTTPIAASGVSVPVGEWCYLEFQGVNSDTVGSFEVRLNGVNILSASGVDTVGLNAEQIGSVLIEGTAVDMYIDDLYILDATGTTNNDFLGEVTITSVYPDGDSTNDWIAVGAGTTNADRVLQTASDGDTTYVHSGTTAEQELYTFAAVDTSLDTIYAVQSVSMVRFDDAGGSRNWRHIAKSVSTESLGATTALIPTYEYALDIHEQDPNAAAAWTPTTVNAAVFGFEVV